MASAAAEPGRHFEEEGSNVLLGSLDEKQQMLLDAVEFASREGPQLAGSVTIAFGLRDNDTAPDYQHSAIPMTWAAAALILKSGPRTAMRLSKRSAKWASCAPTSSASGTFYHWFLTSTSLLALRPRIRSLDREINSWDELVRVRSAVGARSQPMLAAGIEDLQAHERPW
jgi:hypothetical protein